MSADPERIIGIDAGGTFTDLVLVDSRENQVLKSVKTETDNEDLIRTIQTGLDDLLEGIDASCIRSVNLATTFATNALVEKKMRPTALIMIGYHKKWVREIAESEEFSAERIYEVQGGHTYQGNEQEPLDEEELARILDSLPAAMEGIGISGYFSVRNSSHEDRAAEIVRERRPDLAISCGHELSTELDSVRRAVTTALNAGLIPIVMELLKFTQRVCEKRGILAPVTVLRGDGTIVGSAWASQHPVEMIMSGPAASACGAGYLCSQNRDCRKGWVVDIGGTTTDLIRLDRKGTPRISETGAEVADYKTLVKAIDISTFGLGGDTRVMKGPDHRPQLGTRRVLPLCRLAESEPAVLRELEWLRGKDRRAEPLFATCGRGTPQNEFEQRILQVLKKGSRSVYFLLLNETVWWIKAKNLDEMEERGLIRYSSFTPTDAMHVLGYMDRWNGDASRAGALLYTGSGMKTPKEVASFVLEKAERRILNGILGKTLSEKGFDFSADRDETALLEAMLFPEPALSPCFEFHLNENLIGVGAPTRVLLEPVGEMVHEPMTAPDYMEVAGAVGAAVGSFFLSYNVMILPMRESEQYRAHCPFGVWDFETLTEAVEFTERRMKPWLLERAGNAGAEEPVIICHRRDKTVELRNKELSVYLYTEMKFEVRDARRISDEERVFHDR